MARASKKVAGTSAPTNAEKAAETGSALRIAAGVGKARVPARNDALRDLPQALRAAELNVINLPAGVSEMVIIDAADLAALRRQIVELQGARDALADSIGDAPSVVMQRIYDGENPIRVWRDHRGLKAKDLAEAAGLSPSYLSDLERGRKSIAKLALATAVDIADALDAPVDSLLPPPD